MELISKNPFRVIGLTSNSKERDFQRQRAKVKALFNIGKEIITDFDFPFLPAISRTEEFISQSFSLIENSGQKLIYSLFWFVSFGNSDDLALDCLKVGNIKKALEIWAAICNSKTNTSRKWSALNNSGSLFMWLAFANEETDLEFFKRAVSLKRELIESDYFADFPYQF